MDDKTKIRLTAAEMAVLWTQYINDTASICVNSYFLEKVEDHEVKPVIEFALNGSKQNISLLKELFIKESFPIPTGFTEKDVHVNAPRLFSDTYFLMYLRNMSVLGMAAGGLALGIATRPEVVQFFKRVLKMSVRLQDLTRDLMLKQGTYVRPPFISTPDKVDFVERQSFLTGFLGEKRALVAQEITMLFNNIQTNAIGKTLITGFAQTAQSREVKEFFIRGKRIAQKHIDIFSDILKKEDLPAPMTWDTALSDSTIPVFSEKLMMFHVSGMIAAGIGNYGASMSGSPRRDLGLKYASLIPEIALYAEDGANIMIKHGWLEEPPQSDNREKLINGE
ncbi:DUF3231 family protein [Robertmurraya korlensis]|uniref:DUF3231 family protein n=1 Tax=Robertmurraya korlensis TaxID=519977 RepID=UPI002041CE93|nr:DUF3231 family protein [Robertmurraya korlensis]MCM3600854.1 DUF3231 family protein [Robertmurraya korlensis]